MITHEKYRKARLNDEVKQQFFESGYAHVAHVLETIERHVARDYSVRNALDFGCGVGRLVVPLAEVAETVTGVDVSESMLAEAGKNCEARGIRNVRLCKSDDALSPLTGRFDFIHSFMVFQHIPVKRGEEIFANLLARLEPGGVCAVHFTYAKKNASRRLAAALKSYVPFAPNIVNAIKGKGFSHPVLQMNDYGVNALLATLQKRGVANFHAEFTDHRGGDLGIMLYFRVEG